MEQLFHSGNYTYRVLPDGTAEITEYSGNAERLMIPLRLGKKAVTGIGDLAFNKCNVLKSVTIPDSVTSLGANPFMGCNQLTDIKVSLEHEYLAVIDGVLFSKKDRRLVCCLSNKKGEYAVLQGIRIIGDYAFYGCSGLTSVTIPIRVTSLGDYAFYGCNGLTSVMIPYSVSSIGANPFSYCTGLTSVMVPSSVTRIDTDPFEDCDRLALNKNTQEHEYLAVIDGALFSKPDKRLVFCLRNKDGEYTLPHGVRIIGDRAFEYCSGLTSVSIPEGVKNIGDNAFFGCKRLNSVTIPAGVKKIGVRAFYGCSGLITVTIPDGVTSIGNEMFYNCKSLTSVTIPGSVTNICDDAFTGCTKGLMLTVQKDSYAVNYCRTKKIKYQYSDALDWLKD